MDQSAFYKHEETVFTEADAYLFASMADSGQVQYDVEEVSGEPDEQ